MLSGGCPEKEIDMPMEFGWLRKPDARNAMFPMAAPPPPVAAEGRERYFRFWMTHGDAVLNQVGPRCTAYGLHHMLMMHPVVNAHRAELPFDPFAAYAQAQLVDEWPGEGYDGTSTNAMMKVARMQGWISGWTWAWSVPTIAARLLARPAEGGGPVGLGTIWWSGMTAPDGDGYVHPRGRPEGGHFYVADLVHTRWINPDGSIGRIGFLNSWGREWGIDGRAYMTFDALAHLIAGDGEAVAASEIRVR
jgi:hypothetical protein